MSKISTATVWLDGCSCCLMSFLGMDERLLAVADKIDLVYGPLVDTQVVPENVDLTIEGAVSTIYTRSRCPGCAPGDSGHPAMAR